MIQVDLSALMGRLNGTCLQAIEAAAGACLSRGHYEVTVDHVLAKLLESPQNDLGLILSKAPEDLPRITYALEKSIDSLHSGNPGKPVFSTLLIECLQDAWMMASVNLGASSIRSGALLLAILARPGRFVDEQIAKLLRGISKDSVESHFYDHLKGSTEAASGQATEPGEQGAQEGSALHKFCVDFTRQAKEDKVDPVFGRDREMSQLIDILMRRRKNNPILVGEAGVGKTAVVEGLARRIVKGDVPDELREVSLLGLDLGLLQAGAGMKGEFEHRLKSIIQEIEASPKPIILFIDEAHTLIGAGGSAGGSDAANLLKPALARGELRTIAATTWAEYKKYFEKDAALARRFQPVKLEEPSVEDAIHILRGLKSRYEGAHGVTVRDSAIRAAADYSSRYINGRQLPDKAVDLLDTSAARVKGLLTSKPASLEAMENEIESCEREQSALERDGLHGDDSRAARHFELETHLVSLRDQAVALHKRWMWEKELTHRLIQTRKELSQRVMAQAPAQEVAALQANAAALQEQIQKISSGDPLIPTEVDSDMVAQVVSDWTGIPLGKVLRQEAGTVAALEENLSQRIKGQTHAVTKISETLRAAKMGLKEPHQPLGVFLLVGPSGVGKTETALSVADLMFGGDRYLTTINMSEFQESHSASRLIGSPPGYVGYGEGGVLTEAVRQKPYSVVLIDEVEKGHLDVTNLFYQVFDKGTLADGEGRVVDFKNTVIFLTSNLASEEMVRLFAKGQPTTEQVINGIRPLLSRHFKPALLARMTIVPYSPLQSETLKDIVQLKLQRLVQRIAESHHLELSVTDEVLHWLTERCLEVESGARKIDRLFGETLLPLISREILSSLSDHADLVGLRLKLNETGECCLERVQKAQKLVPTVV